MFRFPEDRVYRRRRRGRVKPLLVLLVLAALLVTAWYFDDSINGYGPVPVTGQALHIADGDSFALGPRKLRLQGIDAPELHQSCKNAAGQLWPCGRAAQASLELMLTQPGLACDAEAHDRYARSLAYCHSQRTADIAAAQVAEGFAISAIWWGTRSYGDEEDAARAAKRGIWQGDFEAPADFRARNAESRAAAQP
jgi:endonuclease YncB( thermonuclease family)